MATYDFETLQVMQTVYDDVVEEVSKDARYGPSEGVRDVIARSIFEIAESGTHDIHQIERYAFAKAMTVLAGMTA